MQDTVILVQDNQAVIDELKKRGGYDLMMAQAERVKDVAKSIVTMKQNYPDCLIYYRYFSNHPDPKDNGWQMLIVAAYAAKDPAFVEEVERILMADHETEIKVLFDDDPLRRN